jgi:hypothetical protein
MQKVALRDSRGDFMGIVGDDRCHPLPSSCHFVCPDGNGMIDELWLDGEDVDELFGPALEAQAFWLTQGV